MANKKHPQKNTNRNSVRKLCLSTSLLTILAAPAMAQQGVLANGTDVIIPPGTAINTNEEFIAGAGVLVINDGSAKTDGPVSITTERNGAAGVWTEGNGSDVDIQRATIITNGGYSPFGGSAYGILAKEGAVVSVRDSDVTTNGAYADGIRAVAPGSTITSVSVTDTDVTTGGTNAVGVLSQGANSFVNYNGGTITSNGDLGNAGDEDTSARYATVLTRQGGQITMSAVEIANKGPVDHGVGVLAQDVGSHITVNDSVIDAAQGGSARDGGILDLNNTRIDARHQGVFATGDAAEVNMTGGSINMTASNFRGEGVLTADGGTASLNGVKVDTINNSGHGALIMGQSTANLTDTSITTFGTAADGVRVGWNEERLYGGTANVSSGRVVTNGDASHGIHAIGEGSMATVDGASIQTSGAGAHGAFSESGAAMALTDSKVRTTGYAAAGARASGVGSDVTVTGGSVTTSGDNAWALAATDGGHVTSSTTSTADRLSVLTSGKNARAVWAINGGTIDVRNSDIVTTGGYDSGISEMGSSWGARGVSAEDGGSVALENTTVKTQGQFAHGVYAAGLNDVISAVKMSNGAIQTNGPIAHGARVLGNASIALENVDVTTSGAGSVGVSAGDGGTASINGGKITTAGDYAFGVYAEEAGALANVTDATITTGGEGAHGVYAYLPGQVVLNGGSVTTKGNNAFGIIAENTGTVAATGAEVTAKGAGSTGVMARYSGGPSVGVSTVTLDNSTVKTSGTTSHGVEAANGGAISGAGNTIATTAASSHGLYAHGEAGLYDPGSGFIAVPDAAGSSIDLANTSVTTNGAGADGAVVEDGAAIRLTDSRVTAKGSGAAGLRLDNGTINVSSSAVTASAADGVAVRSSTQAGQTNKLDVSGSQFVAEGLGIDVQGEGVSDLSFKDSTVTSKSDRLLEAATGTTRFGADNSRLTGDIAIGGAARADFAMANGSLWTGAGNGLTSLDLDKTSQWLMTGNSSVSSLINDGTIEFSDVNPYKTLSVGTLSTNDGTFLLNTRLNEGGAASQTDRIVVAGNAEGNGNILIRNNGGTGAVTGTGPTDGIQVVQIGGASNAKFKLSEAAIIGNYDYQLAKADGQNWYLQTSGQDPVPDDNGGNDNGGGSDNGGGDNGGHMADIIPGYNIALSAAQQHVLTTLDTFHERVGELRSEELEDGFHAWTRGIGKTGSYSPEISGYAGHGFDQTTGGFQIGGDYSSSDVFVVGDKLTFGMFGEYAHSNFDVRGRTADGSITSKGLGGYVTWQQKAPTNYKPGTGAYVDAVVKHDWLDFDVRAKSVSGFDLENGYKGRALSASIETGYGFDLGNNVVLQPQAQLTWSKVDADDFTDSSGIVIRDQQAESLIGRLGVRLEKTFYFGENPQDAVEQVQPKAKGKKGRVKHAALPVAPKKKKFVRSVTTFVDANARHEFKGENGLIANGDRIGSDMSGTRYDVGAGVVARVNKDLSLYARGAVEFGGSTNVAGKVSGGFKITW
ncbi:autotransporter outer membrane beta-barrel domain-containing protein [Brucella cytisi]|uniref:autotransporter outer membrane beta-barrel domain-containing protein n=1 Tax=Brucella cytisi TaxID=407152 RepID=UPI0035DFD8B5